MEIIGIIPARYQSTRMPGKPIVDICGKPMIWWVYQQALKAKKLNSVVCAIDDERVEDACKKYNIPYVMTKLENPNHIARVQEVSDTHSADYYLCINGDEPMISPDCIDCIVPDKEISSPIYFGACRKLADASETIDFANIKIVLTSEGRCLYLSRSPIPYPRGSLNFNYYKYIGIECYNKAALDLFVSKPMSMLEKVEDIDHLRFIEYGVPMYFKEVTSESISVDTKKDLEYVIEHMSGSKCNCT